MVTVLFDETLYFIGIIVDAVCRERKAVGIEPVMVASEHLGLDVVANLIDKVDFKERFAAYEIPNDGFLLEILFVAKDIVDSGLGHFPRHPLLLVFADKVTIFASQLAVLGDDKSNALRAVRLPVI